MKTCSRYWNNKYLDNYVTFTSKKREKQLLFVPLTYKDKDKRIVFKENGDSTDKTMGTQTCNALTGYSLI